MTKLKLLWRRRKNFIVAFMAATGSFLLGVTWPINFLRANQPLQPIQAQVLAVSQPQEQQPMSTINKFSKAIANRVEFSQQSLAQLQAIRFQSAVPGQFQGTTIRHGKLNSQRKAIALTFDDGPWPKTTTQILDILKENNIKATFFWVGKYLKNSPEIGQQVVAAGHAIGNHTWNHEYLQYNEYGAAREIDGTSSLIEELTGVQTSMFRPPGGILNNGLATYAQKKNYAVVMWSADSFDWRTLTESLIDNVMRQANSGGIVLMHDGGGNRARTVKALPDIIARLRNEGYIFVTVPELLHMQEQDLQQQETAQQ
ncbi:polysaccharide deacetylase family protein [Microcoleus vaginatus]|uniref:polysaccharide deacetylase family protein n=1 Tax=Microcoleus vaginatus TaxID=119532 RepID=UPI001F60FB4E